MNADCAASEASNKNLTSTNWYVISLNTSIYMDYLNLSETVPYQFCLPTYSRRAPLRWRLRSTVI